VVFKSRNLNALENVLNVSSLPRHSLGGSLFKTDEAKTFFAEWRDLHSKECVPHFRTLFSKLSSTILPHLVILEQGEGGAYVLRYVGTKRVDLWGKEPTNSDGMTMVSQRTADAFRRNVETLSEHPCALHAINDTLSPQDGRFQSERILIPVKTDLAAPRRVASFNAKFGVPEYVLGGTAQVDPTSHTWIDIGFGVPAEPTEEG